MLLVANKIGHESPISGVATFNNQYVATAGYDSNLILWDYNNLSAIAVARHDHLVNSCEFSKDGKYLLSSSSDHTCRVWSVPELRLVSILNKHQDDVEMSAFSVDGLLIATASRDFNVRVYELSGKLLNEFKGHEKDVISVSWCGDNVVSSSDDGTIRIWNTLDGKCSEVIDLGNVETDTLVCLSKDVLVAGNDDGEVTIIHQKKVEKKLKLFKAGVKRLVYDKNQKKVLALSYDRTLVIIDASNPLDLQVEIKTEYPKVIWARSAAFIGSDAIVLGTFGSSFAIYNYNENKWQLDHIDPTLGINGSTIISGDVYTVGDAGIVKKNNVFYANVEELCNFISGNSQVILAGGQSGTVFELKKNKIVYTNESPINCSVFTKLGENKYFVLGDYIGNLIVLEEVNGDVQLVKKINLLTNAVKGVSVSGSRVFVVGAASDCAIFNLANFQLEHYKVNLHDKIINDCTSLQENYFASVSRDLSVRIINTDGEVNRITTPHKHSIKCIGASSDGRYVATGSYVGQLGVYDLHEDRWVTFSKVSRFGLSSIQFDDKLQQFVITSYDGKTYSESLGIEHAM